MKLEEIRILAERIRTQVGRVVVGKEQVVDYMVIAMLTSGHILLEDVPGTGKTLLAKATARAIEGTFKRVQFTPDLLPSDLSGIQFYNQQESAFTFRPGPLFTNILLADEINRATPRTQSSLLECMEERQVTVDGETRPLSAPFLVIATQNPIDNQGTFPLPEAQLDRFLFKVSMGYPTVEEGMAILKRFRQSQPLDTLEPVVRKDEIVQAQQGYTSIYASDDVLRYMLELVERTRVESELMAGVSPRGAQALLRAAQAHAVLRGRDYVSPDDVKAMVLPVLAHRIIPAVPLRERQAAAERILRQLMQQVAVPTEAQAQAG